MVILANYMAETKTPPDSATLEIKCASYKNVFVCILKESLTNKKPWGARAYRASNQHSCTDTKESSLLPAEKENDR